MSVEYLTTAGAEFVNLQSGMARPYWEVNISVSATASTTSGTLGQAYDSNNKLISFGAIDREKSITITGTDKIVAADVTFKLDNSSGTFSPLNSNSIFYNKDYLNSIIKIWAGFVNVGGTAIVVQKGTFCVEELSIDSQDAIAYLQCTDKLRYGLEKYLGLPGDSGTANSRIWTGTTSSKAIITDMLSGLGMTAGDYDISAGINFTNLTVSGKTYSETLAKIAIASEGFIYVDNVGKIRFRQYVNSFGETRPTWDLNINSNILKAKYTVTVENLINKVAVRYEENLASYNSSEDTTVVKGRNYVTDNQVIQTRAQAQAFTSRNLRSFNEPISFLEIDNVWMPAIELGDYFRIMDTNLYLSGTAARTYEVYKIRDDISNLKQKLYLVGIAAGLKIGYLSDTATDANSVIYTGGWTSGFLFLGYETATAAYPGFDAGTGETPVHSGANNNAIDYSGLPNESIEQPFVLG